MLAAAFLEHAQVFEALVWALGAGLMAALGFLTAFLHKKGQLSKYALLGLRLSEAIQEEVIGIRAGLQPTIARVTADGIVTALEREEVLNEVVRLVKARMGDRAIGIAMRVSGVVGIPVDKWLAQKIAPVLEAQKVLAPLVAAAIQPAFGVEYAKQQAAQNKPLVDQLRAQGHLPQKVP